MTRSAVWTLAAAIAVLAVVSPPATMFADSDAGRVSGTAVDSSGALLPGVTVVASSRDKQVLASTTTDAKGSYALNAVPAGPVDLRFELEGFAPADIAFEVKADTELRVNGRLDLAARSETVEVVAPVGSVAPIKRAVPVVIPVPEHDRDAVCGPAKPRATVESLGTIQSRLLEGQQGLYAEGDQLLISGGTESGLEPGRNLVARRHFIVRSATGKPISGEHSSGLLQIVAADARTATAVVVYACDELMKGDFLASFNPEPKRQPDPAGIPSFDNPARVLFADAGQIIGVPERLMVIDRGSSQGLHAGQRLTLFRSQRGSKQPTIVGGAIVVAVRDDSATIRVESGGAVVQFGDFAGVQK